MFKSLTPYVIVKKVINMRRAEEICEGVSVLHDEAVALAEAVVLMSIRIKESAEELKDAPLVIPYDNGGGQSGIRENPQYTAFEKLMASYNKSLRQLTEIVDRGSPSKKTIGVMKELNAIAGKKAG